MACLIIVTITILILTRKSTLIEGSPFPTSTIKIINNSSITFDTIRCYDTDGNIYTPIQGLSTPRVFTPQDNFIVNMKNQTSLLCIAMKDTIRYITILGNDNSTIHFIFSNTTVFSQKTVKKLIIFLIHTIKWQIPHSKKHL